MPFSLLGITSHLPFPITQVNEGKIDCIIYERMSLGSLMNFTCNLRKHEGILIIICFY